jgi:hypothetical protein
MNFQEKHFDIEQCKAELSQIEYLDVKQLHIEYQLENISTYLQGA